MRLGRSDTVAAFRHPATAFASRARDAQLRPEPIRRLPEPGARDMLRRESHARPGLPTTVTP